MNLKQTSLRAAHAVGVHQPIIDAYDKFTFPDIDEAIKNYQGPENIKGRIFIPLMQGEHKVHSVRNLILAHGFRTRGYEPHVLMCDSGLDLCHAKSTMDDTAMCALCERRGENISNKFGIEITKLSEVLPEGYELPHLENDISTYKGVPVSEYAISSARCHLKRYTLDMKNKEHKETYYRFLRSAIVCVDAAECMFDKYDFDATLTQHAAYIYGGIFMNVSENREVPAYDGSAGYYDQSLKFGKMDNRLPLSVFSSDEITQDRLKSPLTEEEKEWLDSFMKKRSEGKNNRIYHAKYGEKGINKKKSKITVGLFTNLNWDGMLDSQDIVFNGPFDWLETSIDEFKRQNKMNLIIKTHPAETIHGTNESVYKWVQNRYDVSSIPNLELLSPETEVDPYELIEQIDAALVYRSTAGLESAYSGVPVVVGADAHYRDLGFTYDPDDPKEYLDFIQNIGNIEMSDEMIKKCQRYCYLLFKEKHIHFQYRTKSEVEGNFRQITHEDIKTDEDLDLIVSRIISGEPVSYRSTQ